MKELLHLYMFVIKHAKPLPFLPVTASNDPYPKFVQSRIGKILTYFRTRVLYEKLRVNCTCVERVIFCRFQTQ